VNGRFSRSHAIDIPAERVDFTVVRKKAERLRKVPGRERVGTVPLVHQGKCG
jgi:hypothetical protein